MEIKANFIKSEDSWSWSIQMQILALLYTI